ncbi:MAG TPA: RluA family pseudouridine synthase [Acidimicrobiales bacterium]|nr:RluA family pseudouridine synthase [Acidimicrobiales bacterium]
MKLTVPAALEAERVDRGAALLVGLSRAEASRLVDEGRVRISGLVVRAGSRRLRSGELLEVDLAGHTPLQPRPAPRSATSSGPPPAAAVVFADEDLVVVDKPAGLVVHPGAGNSEGTLVQQLVRLFPEISAVGPEDDRPGIVQRLDKGTSGLMVVARTSAAREGLVAQLAARSVERAYLAVVHGELEADEGTVDAPLGRSQSHRVKMAVVQGGRQALTHYRAESRSTSPVPVTLVSCRLGTGRTHQVRVHFAAIGHPLLCDDRYSKPSQLAAARTALPGLRRPWLHAARLGFTHPVTGEPLRFSSELPADLAATLGPLGLSLPQ